MNNDSLRGVSRYMFAGKQKAIYNSFALINDAINTGLRVKT